MVFSYEILIFFTYFLGYCGIQYSAYSATSPDAFILDDITITANNVSSSLFFRYREKVWYFVTIIALTYCEKKLRKKFANSRP